MIYTKTIDSPVGNLGMYADEKHLLRITFCAAEKTDNSNSILEKTSRQLRQYFAGERTKFDIPLNLNGTDFQLKVWKELQKIPYGKRNSYQELAGRIGNIEGARAVGTANHHNPIPIIIPCHRVVRKNGDHGGYGGGIEAKKFLLDLETKK